MVGGASRISKTRSTEPRDCCTVLKERMSSRPARWRRATAAMNEKASPGVKAPEITRDPAYHTMPTMLKAPSTSMVALDSSSIRMSLRASPSMRLLSRSQRACSKLSRPKAFTILAPVKDSCRSTKSSAMRSWVRRLIR